MINLVIGAALALAAQLVIQFHVVPLVDARKRLEGRWEQAVRDLKELLATTVSDRGSDAQIAQGLAWDLWQLEVEPGEDRHRIGKIRGDQIFEARKATRAFTDLAHTRVDLLTEEIVRFRPDAPEIERLGVIARNYWLQVAMVSGWTPNDAETQIEKRWKDEYRARTELIRQTRLLADLRRPPRVSPLRRGQRRARTAISWARTGVRRPADQTL